LRSRNGTVLAFAQWEEGISMRRKGYTGVFRPVLWRGRVARIIALVFSAFGMCGIKGGLAGWIG